MVVLIEVTFSRNIRNLNHHNSFSIVSAVRTERIRFNLVMVGQIG